MLEIKEADFEREVLQSTVPVLVDFYATWCPPCKALAPILEKIEAKNQGNLKIVKVNTDEATGLAVQYNVAALPTIMLMKNGKAETTLVGLQQEKVLQEAVDAVIASS